MSLVQRNSWSVLDQLDRQFNSMLRQDDSTVVTSRWLPAVDIREQENQFLIQADLPGIDPSQVEITMERNVLTIKGERQQQSTDNGNSYRHTERVHGTFYRRFSLPESVDADRIQARSEHGVLSITIPKVEKAQPRRISVAA